jgi:hypothetical protein
MNLGAYQCIDMFLMFPLKNKKKRTPLIFVKKKYHMFYAGQWI